MNAKRVIRFLQPTFFVIASFAIALLIARFFDWGDFGGEDTDSETLGFRAMELSSEFEGLAMPDTDLSPRDVVHIQLAGLSDERWARGIAQCMTFASPANRMATGPLVNFGDMVRQQPYDVLIAPDAFQVGEPTYEGNIASILVTVVKKSKLHSFMWVLSKQTMHPFENCWMTDAVFRVGELPDIEPNSSPNQNDGVI